MDFKSLPVQIVVAPSCIGVNLENLKSGLDKPASLKHDCGRDGEATEYRECNFYAIDEGLDKSGDGTELKRLHSEQEDRTSRIAW